MATPVRNETRNVTDDNISTQVQSKVNRNGTANNAQTLLNNLTVKDDQVRQYQRGLHKFENILNGLKQEEEKLSETDDIQITAERLLKLEETIEKVEHRIQSLIEKIQSLEIKDDKNILHEHIDATGVYYLYDTLTSTNKRFYPKDCVFDYTTSNVEDIPLFLNNFRKFTKRYQFDDVFNTEITKIDPRENEILCKIIKEGLNENLDIMNTTTSNIFKIINGLKTKYKSLHGREVRIKAWEKVLVDTTCRDSELLMNKLQKLVLMEKWIFSKCCEDCPTLRDYLQEAILGTLHESLRNPVKQRLYNVSHNSDIGHEEFLINTVIETVVDLSPMSHDLIEKNCKYCKSVLHCSRNCRRIPNKELRLGTTNFSKTYYSQGMQRAKPFKTFEKTKEEEQNTPEKKAGNY